jgi:VanZ family protein
MDVDRKLAIVLFLVLAESGLLLYFSLLPGRDFPVQEQAFPYADLALHFVGYAAYGVLWERTLRYGNRGSTVLMAFVIGSLYGGVMEALQAFVPLRSPGLLDWLADAAGAGMGGYLSARKRR